MVVSQSSGGPFPMPGGGDVGSAPAGPKEKMQLSLEQYLV